MATELSFRNPPIESLDFALLRRAGVSLNVLRLDKCHPSLTGNKWFKLKYNLLAFQRRRDLPVVSFGGAYSNHLHALAAAGKLLGLRTIGLVRGELVEPLNPILAFAKGQGMTLFPVTRSEYRRKQEPEFLEQLQRRFGDFHLLPEGGSNSLAIKGCAEIAEHLKWQNVHDRRLVALCCGTGTTMAGILSGLSRLDHQNDPEVLGISVLKGEGYLQSEVERQLKATGYAGSSEWQVADDYHCGGYARSNASLRSFLRDFSEISSLPLEPVYTGKLFYALFDLIERGAIAAGTEVLAIHSGGIHG